MPNTPTDKKVTCSCLRAELGIFFLPMEDVLKALYQAYPTTNFQRVTREEFPVYYRKATNGLIKATPEYLSLGAERKARIDHWMDNRCTLCSFLVLRHMHQMHEKEMEAA